MRRLLATRAADRRSLASKLASRSVSFDIRDGRFLERSSDVRGVAVGQADSLDQQDDDHLTLRIDPTLCAERAAVPKGSRRKILRGALRFADDAPTQSPAATGREARFQVAGLHLRHLPYRFCRKHPMAFEFAAVENHLVEAAQVAVRVNPEWRRRFLHLAMRRGRKIAKVAMARRLAVALYWMWRKQWDYKQVVKFGSHVRQPELHHGVQSITE